MTPTHTRRCRRPGDEVCWKWEKAIHVEKARENRLHVNKKQNAIFVFFYTCRTNVGRGKHRSRFICILNWRGQGEGRRVRWKCVFWDQHEEKDCVLSQDEKTGWNCKSLILFLSLTQRHALHFCGLILKVTGCSLFDLWDSGLFLKISRLKTRLNLFICVQEPWVNIN